MGTGGINEGAFMHSSTQLCKTKISTIVHTLAIVTSRPSEFPKHPIYTVLPNISSNNLKDRQSLPTKKNFPSSNVDRRTEEELCGQTLLA
jgi:hypothetical protein